VLLVALLPVLLAWMGLRDHGRQIATRQFELLSREIHEGIEQRLRDHEQILLGGAGLFDASETVSRQEWHDYIVRLRLAKNYPGILGVGYSQVIQPDQLAAHIASVRAQGFPDYQVKPPGERPLYTSIVYLEPFSGRNLAAFGYDMFSQEIRRAAMQSAVDTNATTISGKVRLVQETHGKEQAGFLMYVPIYRPDLPLGTAEERWKALRGFVYSPYRVDDLMAGILGKRSLVIEFRIYDGEGTDPDALMYDSAVQHEPEPNPNPGHTGLQRIQAYGRTWTLSFHSRPAFDAETRSATTWLVLGLGIGISLALFAVTRLLLDLKEAEQKSRRILESAGEGIYGLDDRGLTTFINPSAARMLGYAPEELIGRSMHAAVHYAREDGSDYPVDECPMYSAFTHGTVHNCSSEVLWRKDGSSLPIEYTTTPIRKDGRLAGAVVTFRDITERRRAESQLIQARQGAEAANRAKSTFLATMSHEIRTPLNGVVGTIDMLAHTKLLSEQQDLVRTAKDSARMLQEVIDDVLDFSKIESGRLELENIPMSLETILETLGGNLAHLAAKQGVELLIYCDPGLPTVEGDPVRLNQILFNLTGNAIKFSKDLPDRSGCVMVSIMMRDFRSDHLDLLLRIEDNGIGMSAEVRERLFQPFVQGEGETTRRFGGTGLGLVISRRLLELMGGHIEVQSEPNQGATFSVFLSLKKAATSTQEPGPGILQGVRVLLIGSEEVSTRILDTYLRHADAEVILVSSQDAVAKCRELCDGRSSTVVVIDNHGDQRIPTSMHERMRRAAESRDLRFVLVERGRRVQSRFDREDCISLDLNTMRRSSLINAVAVAAGRESLDLAAEPESGIPFSDPVGVDAARAAGRLILLADDNETNRKVIGQQLSMLGYGVEFAEDGRQALEKFQAEHFNLLLTDCHMPVMDGYQLSRRIRELEDGAEHTPIIAISADALKGTARKCFDAGMDDYVTKPIQLHELRALMDKWLGSNMQTGDAQTRSEPSQSSQPQTVDPAALGELLGTEDPAILRDFYGHFLQTNAPIADQMHEADVISDIAELGHLAHKLKSSARTLGANGLADSCQIIEEAAKAGDAEGAAHEMGHFSTLFRQVREWIESN